MVTFKAAVIQAASIAFDLEATLAKLESLVQEASSTGAKLLVFPEAFLGGYPKGTTFEAYIGGRTQEGREWFNRYYQNSIQLPSPELDRLIAIAKKYQVMLVIGVIEKDGYTLYCTIIHIDPQLGYLGKHRKVMPTAAEKLIWGFGDASTLSVFDTTLGKLGSVICWENYMPLLRMTMYHKGIQLYCAPTADDRDSWVASMQHIAKEGRCFVFSSCQFNRRKDYPMDYPTLLNEDLETVYFRGGSCIVNPMGELLVGPNFEKETILYADIDMDDIIRYHWEFDVVGHYSRPDLFQLNVNENVQSNIIINSNGKEYNSNNNNQQQIQTTKNTVESITSSNLS
ncbi:putative nitrilase [Neoconidiobolus thromboides FSU 785]|nr:putative nitrilase [Neoconidiobolus thromboides FSU 785]